LTDKRSVVFKDRLEGLFEGSGQLVGGDTVPSRLVPSKLEQNKQTSTQPDNSPIETQLPGKKLSMDQFLNKIPANVIKGGRIVDIRSSLGATLTGHSDSPHALTMVDTPAAQQLKERMEQDEGIRPPSSRELTTLRIKSEQGDHTYILKMRFSDTIRDVRDCLNKQRSKASTAYQIMSTFPNRVYDDDFASLKECGLTPSATLHLKPFSG
ncbi:hypothetical protein CAPTEDRAFT_208106, partial [Capitella teleta]